MRISSWLSSMWCAYFFALLAFVSFPQVIATGNIILIDSWLAQTFIQLVALSILGAGQKYSSPHDKLRADAQYEANLHMVQKVDEILEEIKNK